MLSEAISDQEAQLVLFRDEENREYLRSDVASWVYSIRRAHPMLCGQSVVLTAESNLEMMLLLLLCDGWVRQLLILPPELAGEQSGRYIQQADAESIISLNFTMPLDSCSLNLKKLGTSSAKRHSMRKPTNWIIATSGTTAQPKLVSHTAASLSKTVKKGALGSTLVWGLLYDVTRFAGLQVFFQALLGGSTLAIPSSCSSVSEKVSHLSECGCNALSATPTMWRNILMSTESASLDLCLVSLGGEIAHQAVLDALVNRFPNAKIRHIYASTEAGVGFAVSDGREGFPVDWLQNSPSGQQIRIGKTGRLELRPSKVDQEYLSGEENLVSEDGFIDTGDVVEIRGDRVVFLGRENGAINVGGNKVQPEEVESVLVSIPGVKVAQVSGIPNSMMGNLVAANIVTAKGVDESTLREIIMQLCRESLPSYKRPAIIKFVDSLSMNASGKLLRK